MNVCGACEVVSYICICMCTEPRTLALGVLNHSHLLFWDSFSHWTQRSLIYLYWLASKLLGFNFLMGETIGICCLLGFLHGCWRSKFKILCLGGKHLINLTISPAIVSSFRKIHISCKIQSMHHVFSFVSLSFVLETLVSYLLMDDERDHTFFNIAWVRTLCIDVSLK